MSNQYPMGQNPYDPYAQYSTPYLPEHPQANTVLILGIVSLFVLVTGPFAWVMGGRIRREMRENPGRWAESSGLTVGWIFGIIGTLILIVAILLVLGAIGLFAAVLFGSR